MIRLFVPDFRSDSPVALSPDAVHYLFHVMRLQAGDSFIAFNGQDGEWCVRLITLNKKEGVFMADKQIRPQNTLTPLILCPALIKKDPMDFMFQKATEIGVTAVYPLITERTVVSRLNTDRARSILIEAAEQSERLTVPELFEPQTPADVLRTLPPDIQPICLAERQTADFRPIAGKPYALFIGPEGGWTPAELDLFRRAKVPFWHLGSTILRAETAAIAALACCRF